VEPNEFREVKDLGVNDNPKVALLVVLWTTLVRFVTSTIAVALGLTGDTDLGDIVQREYLELF
jgi:hypothetical protein